MKCLMIKRRDDTVIKFLTYGSWSIEQHDTPQPLTDEQIVQMIKEITCTDLRVMIDVEGKSSEHIQSEPHRLAGLSSKCNEDDVIVLEMEINWHSLYMNVEHMWTVHVRLQPPLVESRQNF